MNQAPDPIHSGMRFGDWTVLNRAPLLKARGTAFFCRCACGTERIVHPQALRSGNSTSCGCSRRPDITGQSFGLWTPIKPLAGRSRWVCLCQCGTSAEVTYAALRRGTSLSCGCNRAKPGARLELAIETLKKRATYFGPAYQSAIDDLELFAVGKLPVA